MAYIHKPIWLELYTKSVFFGQYRSVFLGITIPIPKENSVGTFSIVDTKK